MENSVLLNFYFYFYTGVKKAKPKKIKKKDDLGALLTEGLAKAPKVISYICCCLTLFHTSNDSQHILTQHLEFIPSPIFSKDKSRKRKRSKTQGKGRSQKEAT
jgi:hypothetical protein